MGNFNVQVDLTKLPGAKVMTIQGKKESKLCVVIPIDNEVGTVCDGYEAYTKEGFPTIKSFEDVKLTMVAIEYKNKRHGITHGLKPSFTQKFMDTLNPEQLYNTPWLGTMKPWSNQHQEQPKSSVEGDLPGDDENDW